MSTDRMNPPGNAAAVTPNDSTDLTNVTRAINVAAAGNVAIDTEAGDSVTLYVAAGIAFPVNARRIKATGTTATGIVALW